MLFEPKTLGFVLRQMFGHGLPKCRRMVGMAQMANLMHAYIIYYRWWCAD